MPIVQTPGWLLHNLDPRTDATTWLRMGEDDYRKASFLDQRAIGPGSEMRHAAWSDIAAAIAPDARRDAQYIFHIGNVGSTLISRLLGELGEVLALREPLPLRTFAEMLGSGPSPSRWHGEEASTRVDVLTALLSRTFRPDQRTVVKATSFTSEIAWRLVPKGSGALFLFAAPQHYVENILAGQNSRQTLAMLSPSRLARLQNRCPGLSVDLARMSDARKAALGWACEMASLEESASRLPRGSVMWLDFDRFLTDPTGYFVKIAGHFGYSVPAEAARSICQGPLMRRYSKALEYEFSPDSRREILAEARWRHGAAIADALGWLKALATRHPAVAQPIRRMRRGE